MSDLEKYFYQSQIDWINDVSRLKLCVKARQTGFSYCNCFRLVLLVSATDARLDAYISSRDQQQAALQLDDCRNWANLMKVGFADKGELILDSSPNSSAYVLEFANGRRIYSLSSNPNALAGKRGHVTLDEFALHQDQRLLFRVAKPVTTWGGQLSIISTHRGTATLFYQLIRDALGANPMGWSLHQVPIQKAVDEGIVERINKKLGRTDSRDDYLKRTRAECIDQETWHQEYCCVASDENAAFFSYEILDACTDPSLRLLTLDEFLHSRTLPRSDAPRSDARTFFLGLDVGRIRDLCVLDVGEKIGNITYDRLRIELLDQPFSRIESDLDRLLRLPQLKRACIDHSGIGMQLAEQARERFGWKVEPVDFSGPKKEELAFALRHDFEDRRLRIPADDKLRADLRGLKKELSPSGRLRFIGDTEDSHCDRTWAMALRQHAARVRSSAGALVV
ncbi:MAG TPA: terminase family protein [Candidatus Acidoferrum sp.]|jgi:phage FluMu gp28-like protein|nr:terminase family protein [Candidatus Acidoferrum sp.]